MQDWEAIYDCYLIVEHHWMQQCYKLECYLQLPMPHWLPFDLNTNNKHNLYKWTDRGSNKFHYNHPILNNRLATFHLGFELVAHFDIYFIILHFQYSPSKMPPFLYNMVKVFYVEIIIGEVPYICTWRILVAVEALIDDTDKPNHGGIQLVP